MNPARAVAVSTALLLALLGGVPLWAQTNQAEALQSLSSGTPQQRQLALRWLEEQGDQRAIAPLVALLQENRQPDSRLAAQALWGVWSRSGDEETDRLLHRGTALLAAGHTQESIVYFTEVIRRSPEFAEGYNKRATALYTLGDYEASLRDIDKVLEFNPVHFGALSGAGLCNVALERWAAAVAWFDRALKVNPTMEGIIELRADIAAKYRKPV